MKNLIWIMMLAVLYTGCQSRAAVSLETIKWKIGTFADLKKKPVSMVLTNSEPNLIFSNVIYQQDYSEGAMQIAALIKSADEEEDDPNVPFFIFQEQLWVVFEDGTGSVFPYLYNAGSSTIRAGDGVRDSERLDDFMEWLRVCQVDRQPQKEIAFEQIKWKKGEFSDLKKDVIGLVISDAEPNLDFANAESKDDLSEEASRIAYFFSDNPYVEDFPPTRRWNQQMWLAFKDGTGSVFECYDQIFSDTYIRAGDIARRSVAAKIMLDLVRYRDRLRKEIREGKKEPCPAFESIDHAEE